MSDKSVIRSFFYKYLERILYQGVSFVVQIIIARILDPSDYGIITILTVFISLSQVFVQSGLNTALIQGKDVEEKDYSYVFWVSFFIAIILYGVLFGTAPFIAAFYEMPQLTRVLRVLALILIPGAYNSIQNAKVAREFCFKKLMFCTFIAAVLSGLLGVLLAVRGCGVWTLVFQQLSNQVFLCILLRIALKWKLRFEFSLKRVKTLFGFGWKLLCSSVISTLCDELQSLATGKKYNSATLGHYNRGKQFPQIIVENINDSIRGVMLPTLSKVQDDKKRIKEMMKQSIQMSAYIIFPMMAGLALVSEPLVKLILSDKWLPCVPYLQVQCIVYAFYPIHTTNLQAMNAQGRSDLFLKAEIVKRIFDTGVLFITLVFFSSPIAIVVGRALCQVIGWIINAFPNRRVVGYGFFEQIKDTAPFFFASLIMTIPGFFVGTLQLPAIITLVIQVALGIAMYILISIVFHFDTYKMIRNILQKDRI